MNHDENVLHGVESKFKEYQDKMAWAWFWHRQKTNIEE